MNSPGLAALAPRPRTPSLQTGLIIPADLIPGTGDRANSPLWRIAVVVIIALLCATPTRGQGTRTSGPQAAVHCARPGFWALRKTAAHYGLSGEESSFLADILTPNHLNNPERIMANPAVLDKIFAKTYDRIERQAKSEAEAERDKTLLFSIRQSVEAAHSQTFQISTTRRIPSGYPATLKTETGE